MPERPSLPDFPEPIIRSELPIFYVYIWFSLNGVPIYVGKGHGDRIKEYKWKSGSHNKHLGNLFRKLARQKIELPCVIIRENIIEEEAFELEILLIKIIGRKDLGTGPLYNLTDGGDGTSGIVRTKEHTEKIIKTRRLKDSYKWTDEQYSRYQDTDWLAQTGAAVSAGLTGKPRPPHTEAHNRKIGAALKGREHSREHNQKVAEANRGKPHDWTEEGRKSRAEFDRTHVWITNGITSTKIHKDTALPEGYWYGRTFKDPEARNAKLREAALKQFRA
jgi:hypothetical protein